MIYVLLPAYNEERGLAEVLRRLRTVSSLSSDPYMAVVVDDGSRDDTAAVVRGFARSLNIWLVTHERNLGLGAALRTGIRMVLEDSSNSDDVLVTMDADDSHDPELIPELVRALRKRTADVVIASRFAPGGAEMGVPSFRRWLSRASAFCWRRVAPLPPARDYSSGFRAFRVETLRAARAAARREIPTEPGFTATVELLLRARSVGATAAEVPLVLRYDRKESTSKMRLGSTIMATLSLLARTFRDGRQPDAARRPAFTAPGAETSLGRAPHFI